MCCWTRWAAACAKHGANERCGAPCTRWNRHVPLLPAAACCGLISAASLSLQRRRAQEMTRAQMEVEGRGEQQDPNFALPPSLLRRYEVLVRPRSKMARRTMRDISADCIGSLCTFRGIVTQVRVWVRVCMCVWGLAAAGSSLRCRRHAELAVACPSSATRQAAWAARTALVRWCSGCCWSKWACGAVCTHQSGGHRRPAAYAPHLELPAPCPAASRCLMCGRF